MRSIARPIVFVALVVSFSLIWMVHTDPDVVVAQTRKPIMIFSKIAPFETGENGSNFSFRDAGYTSN